MLTEFREAKTASSLRKGVALEGRNGSRGKTIPGRRKDVSRDVEAGRFFPGGTAVLLLPNLRPEALRGTPASWLITSVHPAMRGDECLVQMPSIWINGQS